VLATTVNRLAVKRAGSGCFTVVNHQINEEGIMLKVRFFLNEPNGKT
jgi:hypothetical protein